MAYTPLKIAIPEPCHEDWEGMHPVGGSTARHCDSCAKNVVDFTGFTDAQLHAYVRLNGEKMCGRFRPDQLERPLRAAPKPSNHPLRVAATAAGLMLAASGCGTIDKSAEPADEELETIEFMAGLVTDVPRTGEISIEDIEQPKVCPPPPPSLDGPTMGKIRIPPVAAEPPVPIRIWHDDEIVGDISIEWPEDALIEETAEATHLPPPPPPFFGEPAVAATQVEQGGGGARVQGEVKEAAASATITDAPLDSIPEDIIVDLPEIQVIAYSVMGKMDYHYPRPTGLDFVKDTIRSVLSPASPTPENPSQHPRPRPNELPLHLKNLKVFPNPFVSELTVAIELPSAQRLTVELISPNGRRVYAESFAGVVGANSIAIEPKRRKLTHAAYHLRVTDGAGNMVTRTVVR